MLNMALEFYSPLCLASFENVPQPAQIFLFLLWSTAKSFSRRPPERPQPASVRARSFFHRHHDHRRRNPHFRYFFSPARRLIFSALVPPFIPPSHPILIPISSPPQPEAPARRSKPVLKRPPRPNVPIPPIGRADLNSAASNAPAVRRASRRRIENALRRAGLTPRVTSTQRAPPRSQPLRPEVKHRRLQRARPRAIRLSRKAVRNEDVSQELKRR